MGKIRVLVVDDSLVIRRVVTEELSADPAIEVAGTAGNGQLAIEKLPQLSPDLVILDIEMPVMDGLTALARIRADYPRLPVIMFSSLTMRGAEATLDALALGATDYFTKPGGSDGIEGSRRMIRDQLVPAIKALVQPKSPTSAIPTQSTAVSPTLTHVPTSPGKIQVVAIGVSTGGPNALTEVVRILPAEFPVPVLIVQHMPPMFTRLLADRLRVGAKVVVEEAVTGSVLRPGHVFIAPGDFHMTAIRSGTDVRIELNQDPPENSCRPAADPLFRSVARVYGPDCLAVVLTGMGQDGLRGCEAVRAAGGQVIVQDEASSVVWGMPGSVVRAGLADKILPLSLIAPEIVRRVSGEK